MTPKPMAFALALAAALAGCTTPASEDDGGSPGGQGSVSAYVKDAPSDDFREVHLVFTQVQVHRSSGGGNETDSTATGTATGISTAVGNTTVTASVNATATSADTQGAGWITVFSDPAGVDVDLLNTTGARAAFLGEADLSAGRYQQIRVTVEEAYGVDHNGTRHDITVSGGTVRSVRPFEVEPGQETRLTVDIDLDRSLRQQGNGQWRLTPVIGQTFTAVVEDEASGEDESRPGDVESVPEAS
jgi:hypothetical protein